MSGITGIYSFASHMVNLQNLQQMVDKISHRGPDGSEVWCSRQVGFGHCMLHTTLESMSEKLPFKKGSLAITADARVDNRDELAKILDLPDRPLEKISDSEFILASYEKWNSDCPKYLLGDFSFAIWNAESQQLFCARDHLGIKPFFYHYSSSQAFAFASEAKGLLCLDWIPCRINEAHIADYLTLMFEDKESTSFRDILRLPPASRMWIDGTGIRHETYWELDPSYELKLDSNEAYAERFRQIFTEAVRCRLRTAFPLGTHLSGGLDSSSVTCVTRKILDETTREMLHTFSNIFDKIKSCDERSYIHEVVKQGGYTPHYIHADTFGALTDIEDIWQYEDEPTLGPNHYYPWRINKATHEAGVKVVLDGFDGDTTVYHGLERLGELAARQKWTDFSEAADITGKNYDSSPYAVLDFYGLPQLRNFAKKGRLIAFVKAVNHIHNHFRYSRRSLYVKQGIKPVVKGFFSALSRNKQKKLASLPRIHEMVESELAARVGLKARLARYESPKNQTPSVRQSHWQSILSGSLSLNLELIDRYSSAFSIESRHPFLDRRLVEFCLAIPSDQKFDKGFGRVVMRRGLQNILPEAIQKRGDKANMSPAFISGILHVDMYLFEKVLNENERIVMPYIASDKWREAWQRVKASAEKSDERAEVITEDALVVWRSTVLAMWLQRMQKSLKAD